MNAVYPRWRGAMLLAALLVAASAPAAGAGSAGGSTYGDTSRHLVLQIRGSC